MLLFPVHALLNSSRHSTLKSLSVSVFPGIRKQFFNIFLSFLYMYIFSHKWISQDTIMTSMNLQCCEFSSGMVFIYVTLKWACRPGCRYILYLINWYLSELCLQAWHTYVPYKLISQWAVLTSFTYMLEELKVYDYHP